jgi:hypothetical protein
MRLQTLDLSDCPINSQGIAAISHLNNLQELQLSRTPIRDQDLATLCRLKHLNSLYLDGCANLSLAAVKSFKSKFPKCEVSFTAGADKQLQGDHNALQNIERTLMHQDMFSEADQAIERLMARWQLESPQKYPLIAWGSRLRAQCKVKMRDGKKAGELFKASLDQYEKHIPDDPDIPDTELEYAKVLAGLNRPADALAQRIKADNFWRNHPTLGLYSTQCQANRLALSRLSKNNQTGSK